MGGGHPDAVAKQIRAQSQLPNFRGIRYNLDYHPTRPELRQTDSPDWMQQREWRQALALIGSLGLTFDLQVHVPQLKQAAALTREFSDVHFVLNHCGFPYIRDGQSASGASANQKIEPM
eukprot:SAG31_NODE_1322_length_8786_cov_2.268576_5_plen_119_part_00